jgi:imidazolonepropionase-like amidohydrolase
MTGGHGHGLGIEADGPVECARAARSQLALGVDFVKVMASGGVGVVRPGEDPTHPELSVVEMRAVVEVAGAAGRPVAAHADGVAGISNSLEAGISCIEHGIYLTPDHARFMAENGVVLVPTLSTMTAIARKTEELGLPTVWKGIAEAILPVHRASFQAALDAGVTFAAGTDSYGDIVDEIVEFTTYGISPAGAIRAATVGGAAIARSDRFGTIEEGKDADVIAVAGDPLENLELLRDVRLVVAQGVVEHVDVDARG